MDIKVICVGSSSKDIFFPIEEGTIIETPEDIEAQEKVCFETGAKYRAKERYEAVGGVAANVAHGLAKFGIRSACYSKVGKDDTGEWIIDTLGKAGVETGTFLLDEHVRTDLSAIIVLKQNGERIIFHNRDANDRLEILNDRFPKADWLLVSALNGEWKKNLGKLLKLKEERSLHFALNPGQHNIKDDARAILEAIRSVNVIVLNKDEAIELLLASDIPTDSDRKDRMNDEEFLVQSLHKAGAKIVALTDGRHGAWASDGHSLFHSDILPDVKAIDMTGAGDGFTAAFLASIIEELPLDTALKFGIANGGNIVRFYGANTGHLTKSALESLESSISVSKLR